MAESKSVSGTLQALLADIVFVPAEWDRQITHLTLDSRMVRPGTLFFACSGLHVDGRDYIKEAIQRGAVAILCQDDGNDMLICKRTNILSETAVPIFAIKELPNKISEIAARFYGYPSRQLSVIGITGTNGKTSISNFIAACLQNLGSACGVIGTLGNGVYGRLQPSTHTTPDAVTVQKLLAEFYDQDAMATAMEVSSHALTQGRVEAVKFSMAVFTNLTREHLDYHGNMTEYGRAKRRLFFWPQLRYAIVNADDNFGYQLLEELPSDTKVFAYTLNVDMKLPATVSAIRLQHLKIDDMGMQAYVQTPWGEGEFSTRLLGRFTISNLLAVLAVLGCFGFPLQEILQSIAKLHGVPGRLQVLGGKEQPLVVVDYAHTPDALKHVLMAMREHCRGKLWCVFGCGGNRDKGKRPLMAKVVESYADGIVVTDDNPRHECPQMIMAEIMQGITRHNNVIIEHDRQAAIAYAISQARAGDVVLISGKGHETYQQIGDEKIPFNDVLVAQSVLDKSKKIK